MPPSTRSSKTDFEQLLQRLGRLTVEHLRYPDVYVDAPAFLVVLELDGQEAAIYGGYIISQREAEDGILFRASQLLQCSMVDPLLETCTARLVCEFGTVRFEYQPDDFSYGVSKPKGKHTDHSV